MNVWYTDKKSKGDGKSDDGLTRKERKALVTKQKAMEEAQKMSLDGE